MRRLLTRLWNDDRGALIATEWVFVGTILILGIITGLIAVRTSVIVELTEFAQATMALNQSYSFAGQSNCLSSTAGSQAFDDLSDQDANTIPKFSTDADQNAVITQRPCD